MPTYEVKKTTKRNWSVEDASSPIILRTKMKATIDYIVIAELADGETYEDISESEVAVLSDLPTVNATTFVDPVTSLVRPFMLCKSKNLTRNPKAPHVITVSCQFEELIDGRENPGQACPNTPTDITPQETSKIIRTERVIYKDLENKDCYLVPNVYEPYQAPVVQPIAMLQINLTQYEPYISYADMVNRSFVCNEGAYRGVRQDAWMIGEVTAKEVEVLTCGGKQLWAQVTYPLNLSLYEVDNYTGGDTDGNPREPEFIGHQTAMPLISNYFANGGEGGPKTRFADSGTGFGSVGFVGEDGNALPEQTRPNYKKFTSVPRVNFYGFLQV
tara:strand:+ start:897 stop:1886 length:990 start_codon:yes stop_codon:yes gene_type:complete